MTTRTVNVRLPEQLALAVERHSSSSGLTTSESVRTLLTLALAQWPVEGDPRRAVYEAALREGIARGFAAFNRQVASVVADLRDQLPGDS